MWIFQRLALSRASVNIFFSDCESKKYHRDKILTKFMACRKRPCPWDETWAILSHPLFSFKTHKIPLVLTYLVVHLEGDVKLQNEQHELEPRAHLLVLRRNVDSKHNVVSLDLVGPGVIKGPDLITLLSTPRHEPFCSLRVLRVIHAFCGHVVHCCGGAGSWKDKVVEVRLSVKLKYCRSFVFLFLLLFLNGPTMPNLPSN